MDMMQINVGNVSHDLSANRVRTPGGFEGTLGVEFNGCLKRTKTAETGGKTQKAADGAAESAKESSNEAFDKYQYKDSRVENKSELSVSEKVTESEEEIKEFAKKITSVIAEDLGVSEEEIAEALENLGMTVFDLVQQQNLAALTMELRNLTDKAELLLDADFEKLSGDVSKLVENFLNQMDLIDGQLEEFVLETQNQNIVDGFGNGQMDIPEGMEAGSEMDQSDLALDMETDVKQVKQPDVLENSEGKTASGEAGQEIENNNAEPVIEIVDERLQEEQPDELNTDKSKDAIFKQDSTENFQDDKSGSFSGEGQEANNSFAEHLMNSVQDAPVTFSQVAAETQSYVSVDTMDIIQQIVEKTRVLFESDSTTIEMQLNPENLGKIYLNVSAKEGAIHAQITAQNDQVRAALEAQLVDLRENLNQAGVKVDAIEVTVSTHEFEKNLEQNAKGDERQGERQEEKKNLRRGLRRDSLDELSGLMSEEELLAAKIMRDNGNSVDFSA